MFDELIIYAKANHDGFANVSDSYLQRMFEVYKHSTVINIVDGKIAGFGIYQEWPDLLNFICIVGSPEKDKMKNILAMMKARENVPDKKMVYFDEKTMRLKWLGS